MIVLTAIGGQKHYLAPVDIASFTEAGPLLRRGWANSVVYLRDRRALVVRETAKRITEMIEKEQQR